MSGSQIISGIAGDVAVLTIRRPKVRNAIDHATAQEMAHAIDRCEANEEVRAIILRGDGEIAFSAGADLKAMASGGSRPVHPVHGFAGLARYPRSKPLIAAVNGFALGGGFEIVLACDLVVAADHATFGLPEVRRGIIPAGGGLVRLSRALPPVLATELALGVAELTAADALRLGLVNRVVPMEALMETAVAMASAAADGAPVAVAEALRVLRTARWSPDERSAWWVSEQAAEVVRGTDDAAEGAAAFVERRSPRWSGR